jgi:uncharacterized protein YndB with AHSA1/START domain
MTDRSVTHATFSIERVYDAPVARVWAAWADAEAKSRWFTGVGEREGASALRLDFRVGGGESSSFTPTDGGVVYRYEAVFHDIVPNERIVLTNRMHAGGDPMAVNLVSVEFSPEGGDRTRLTVTDHGAYLDGVDRPEWREAGTKEQLDRLVSELTGHQVTDRR